MLIRAQADPYGVAGLRKCGQLAAAIADLDAVLGDDIDLPTDGKPKLSAGRVAQAAVGSFIPFRGLIREISGANESVRKMQSAIMAGLARRGFLKGYGQARGCRYPARPATTADIAAIIGAAPAAAPASNLAPAQPPKRKGSKRSKGNVDYVAQPVVQKTD